MPPRKYNSEAERKAAKAVQTRESEKRNGHKDQMAYDKATRKKIAQRARRKLEKVAAVSGFTHPSGAGGPISSGAEALNPTRKRGYGTQEPRRLTQADAAEEKNQNNTNSN